MKTIFTFLSLVIICTTALLMKESQLYAWEAVLRVVLDIILTLKVS